MPESGLAVGEATEAAPSPAFAAPPGNPRFPLFDGLRGIAVLAVLLLHSSELSGRVGLGVGGRLGETAGGLGVILFFVISGFLLYRPFAAARATGRRSSPLHRYARRRALRILPAYWIVLTILAAFPGVVGVFTGHGWRYYGFLQAYFSRSTSSGIPVAWTLGVEVTFYAALPVWAAVLARRQPTSRRSFAISELIPLTGLAVVGLVVQVLAARHTLPTVLGSTLPGASLWFAIGMAIAVLSVVDHAARSWPRAIDWLCDRALVCWAVALAAVAGLMVMVPRGGIFGLIASAQQPQPASQTVLRLVLEAIVIAGLILPAVFAGRRSGVPRRIMGSWPLVRLGVISYSFYLWHLTIVEFIAASHINAFSATGLNLMAHVHSARMTVLFVVSLAVAVPISAASYVLFELPFLRRKERQNARRAIADADPVAVVYRPGRPGAPLAIIALEPDTDGLRTAAARAVRACREGGTIAWALDPSLRIPVEEQVYALSEGAVIGGYDGRRWRSGQPRRGVERFVICSCGEQLAPVAGRAALIARWTNIARELVDAPPNVVSPAALAERARRFPRLASETIDPAEAGLGALAAVGASSPARPLLLVLRHEPRGAPAAPRLALVGKAVTFDTGGYFLKSQADIVRQKADMAGGAAVVAALGAIAELGLGLSVTGVVPACENMLSGSAIRPTDVVTTAAGLTVEVTNPDAEGRLILADALWYARQDGATHVVDLATLTGAMRAGMGDLYGGVFAADEAWRDAVVDAGNASGDLAWPWPLHPRYRPLIDSSVADLRNTAGKSFGFPIVAATFIQQFAGQGPWAHVDMLGPALLDEDRGDAFGRGASGYGVRMLIELVTRLSAAART